MATAPLPADIAAAMRYGQQTQQAIRRSQYLTDALKTMSAEGGKNIQSGGELASKLLAQAVLQYGSRKADKATLGALKTDQDSETANLLAGFSKPSPAPPPSIPPQVQPAPQPAPVAAAPLPPVQPQPMATPGGQVDPQTDAMVRTVWGEARGEDPTGQAAVASVILNRSRKSGKSPMDVVMEKGQFEPWGNPQTRAELQNLSPQDPRYQSILANIAPALQGQDVTGGADHFYSPTAQSAAGRPPPKWDNGSGVDHGRHRFFSLGYGGQGAHQRGQVPPPPVPTDAQIAAAPVEAPPNVPPFQVAMNGQIQPDMIPPSAPSPSGAGAPPGPMSPPQAAGPGAPQWPNWQPSQDELGYLQGLLSDPRTHDQGATLARQWTLKATQPAESQIVQMNGVSFYVSKTPGEGGQPVMIPVPQQAMTQQQTAQQASLQSAPQGLNVQRDPFGNLKDAPGAPPPGYNATPEGLAPIRGGPQDPMRPQTPQAGFQYGQGGRQSFIPGGSADPAGGANIVTNEGKLRDDYETQVKGYRAAREGYQKVIQAAGDNTPAGSLSMVFGFMKTLDPTSTVREGEQASVQNSGTIDQSVVNLYNKLLTGDASLTPQQRAQFAETARRQFSVYENGAQAVNQRYTDLAKSYGFDPGRVVQNFAPIEPFKVPGAQDSSGRPEHWSAKLPPAQLRAAQQFKGATAPGGDKTNPLLVQSPVQYQALKPGQWFIDDDGSVVQKGAR